jgi:hypothetical protein
MFNELKDFFAAVGLIMLVIIGVSVIITLLWALLGYLANVHFHQRITVGTPVRLDTEDEQSGWYVVKSRVDDIVELVLIIPDRPERDLSKAKTDVTCDILLLKPL